MDFNKILEEVKQFLYLNDDIEIVLKSGENTKLIEFAHFKNLLLNTETFKLTFNDNFEINIKFNREQKIIIFDSNCCKNVVHLSELNENVIEILKITLSEHYKEFCEG